MKMVMKESSPVSFSFLICKHSGCGLVVEVKRLAEIALFFLALNGTGARIGQHRHRERVGVSAIRD